MEFKKIILENCVNDIIDYRGKTPKKLKGEWNEKGTFRAVSAKNIKNMQLVNLESLKKVDNELYKKWMKKEVSKNNILLTSEAPLGESLFWDSDEKIVLSQRVFGLKPNTDIVNPKYLFAYLQTPKFKHELTSRESGTTVTGIRRKELEKTIIVVPSQNIQKFIGDLFYITNKKIKNNQNIIANLEELSQTLFKRWFVDFEFPDENGNPYKSNGGEMVDSELGAIPKGWNVKNLDDIANYMNGLAMQKFKPTDNQNSLPVVKIKELKNGSTDENSNRCTSEIPEKALIVDGDIIFSWSATLLVKMWCGGKAGLNQHLFKVSSDKYPKWFYYYWTKRYIDYFIGIANDKATTMGHINRKHLSHAKILTPNDQTLEKFSRTFDDLLEKELSVSKESKRLTELRDTLLPKLMSGEIEIPTDIEVNEDELSI